MQDEVIQSALGHGEIAVRIVCLYVASLLALRFAGRSVQSHVRPIDLTALLLMLGVMGRSLHLDDKGLASELVVIVTMSVCARATSWVAAARRGFEQVRGTQPGLALDHALSAPQPGDSPPRWQPSLAPT
ncbi:MAG: hypothetical protein J0L92_00860 [Deltaproteobacteria bacterium]|nr:hypothetical protein [Deltaproteobacteria bacterium]